MRTRGFRPISIDEYVRGRLAGNPRVDRENLIKRPRRALESARAGARGARGGSIWVIGSAETGLACFTCVTGETDPTGDHEIAEAIDL